MNRFACLVCLTYLSVAPLCAAEPTIVRLWAGTPPGDEGFVPEPETDTSTASSKLIADRPIIRLTNVSQPILSVYRPSAANDTGAAVIVCPGGGHRVLAYDLEGTEVAAWLNEIGVTSLVLKYRVPARDANRRWLEAVQDAQRALSIARQNASAWGFDPDRLGILGFSAGGETAGLAALNYGERAYEPQDDTDRVSCRPDFAVLIYPGGLVDPQSGLLRDHVRVPTDAPPFFFVQAWDDQVTVQNSLQMASALKQANISAEVHLYATGGHGYGLRPTSQAVTRWPVRAGEWMRERGFLARKAAAKTATH